MKEKFDLILLTLIVRSTEHVVAARQRARQIAASLGFDSQYQTRLATAVSEIARNAHTYAGIGKLEYCLKQTNQEAVLQVKISDKGPGIQGIKEILSGTNERTRGLRSAQRMVDYFNIQSQLGQGTVVTLGLNITTTGPAITTQKIGQLSDELARNRPTTISDEVVQQNQELLQALNLIAKARDELESKIQHRTEQLLLTNQNLEKANERLHLALQSAQMGTWQWDLKDNELELDDYLYKLFKATKKAYSISTDEKLPFIQEQDNDLVLNQLLGKSHDLDIYDFEFTIRWPDKTLYIMASRGHIYRDRKGSATRMVGICWNITEKKALETMHRQYQKQLAHVERINSMGELASSLSHELNQPLATTVNFIKGSLRRLKVEGYQNKEVLYAMHTAAEQAELAGEILHRMKAFVTKGQLYYENININTLVQECIAMFQYDHMENSSIMRYEPDKELPVIKADKIQLQQVLLNLLRNAVQVLQSSKVIHPAISISVKKLPNQLELTVIDNGPGINQDNINKIWEPNFTTKQKGMGIGLAICRTIIEAHHGKLVAGNNSRGGAFFKIILPHLLIKGPKKHD